jgi:hypothetical protein
MTTLLRWFSMALLALAIGAVATLLISDFLSPMQPNILHFRAGALAFILIGASFITLHFSAGRPLTQILKEVFLGAAFILWGGEQFLDPSLLVTIMDSLVVIIFVTDLSLVIVSRLRQNNKQLF